MTKIDVIDETIIDSPPEVVYKAVLDEYAGVTNWWMPILEFKLRGDIPIDREGAISDITMRTKGVTSKVSVKVRKIVEAKSIEMDFDGHFVGSEEWIFEPIDGKTKVQLRWHGRTNRLLFTIFSPFTNVAKGHSEVIQKGFKALNNYLNKK